MATNTSGYDFLMAVADQCDHRDIRRFIIEQLKSTFDDDKIDEILEEAGYAATDVDIYKLVKSIEYQSEVNTNYQNTVLNTLKELKDMVKLQNHGALRTKPTCPLRPIYRSTISSDNFTTTTLSNDGS